MSELCPKCGLPSRTMKLDDLETALKTKESLAGYCFETDDKKCLRAQLADAKKRLAEVERELHVDRELIAQLAAKYGIGGRVIVAMRSACTALIDAAPEEGDGDELSIARQIDGKFAVTTRGQIIKPSNGEILPHDEPLFLLRARDYLALPLLREFLRLSLEDNCTEYHVGLLQQVIADFEQFARDHADRMKQPGCTRGK